MKGVAFASRAIALAVALSGVAAAASAQDLPKPDAQAVWKYVESQQYRKNWSLMPGSTMLQKSDSQGHGSLVTTYVNPTAKKALESGASKFPAGSILIKENYLPEKTLASYTLMYKSDGFNPQHNDWFWLKRMNGGRVAKAGKVGGCQSCHATAKTDYVFSKKK